jgi:predicted aspartyl protease
MRSRRSAWAFPALLPALLVLSGCPDLTLPPAATVPTGAGEIGFELAGPGEAALVVPVHINGTGPHRFVLDTGATLTCLDQALVEELALPRQAGAAGTAVGVGHTGPIELRRADRVAVGEAATTGMTVCALDLRQMQRMGLDVHGLLGLNFLKSFQVTLDFDRRVLSLQGLKKGTLNSFE